MPIQFTLVDYDFRVKYVGEEHALHLKDFNKEVLELITNSLMSGKAHNILT